MTNASSSESYRCNLNQVFSDFIASEPGFRDARAILTGSLAYGTPREDSDIDILIGCDGPTLDILWARSDGLPKLTFGKLNLIAFNVRTGYGRDGYDAWKRVTGGFGISQARYA